MKLLQPLYPLRIGIDVDGVLADFNRPYVDVLCERAGQPRYEYDPTRYPNRWAYEDDIVPPAVTKQFWKDQRNWNNATIEVEGFWSSLPTLASHEDRCAIRRMAWEHDLFFISNRPLHLRDVTEEWIQENICLMHPLVMHSRAKGAMAVGLDLHAMIDDKPKNLHEIMSACGTSCVPILLDQPWNKEEQSPYIIRVGSLREAFEVVEREVQKCQL